MQFQIKKWKSCHILKSKIEQKKIWLIIPVFKKQNLNCLANITQVQPILINVQINLVCQLPTCLQGHILVYNIEL